MRRRQKKITLIISRASFSKLLHLQKSPPVREQMTNNNGWCTSTIPRSYLLERAHGWKICMKYDRHAAHIYDVHLLRRVKHFDEGHGSFHDLTVSFASNDALLPPSILSCTSFTLVLRKKHFLLCHQHVAKGVK